jgi:hypothetical protein
MTHMRRSWLGIVTVALVLALAAGLSADVKSKQKTQIKFEGMLGKMFGMFAGKAAKEGVVSTVAVSGDREMTVNDQTGELIDLAAEKVYRIDFKGKTYKVQTFAEIRKEWEDAQAKMKEQAGKDQARDKSEEPQYEIEFDIQKTGQSKAINGYNCQEVVMTITMHQKGKKLEDGGGLVITADSWLGPKIPAMAEQMAFQQRYIEKLYGKDAAGMARDLAQAMAMYPQMKDGMARMQKESGKLDGTPILTVMKMESVQTPEQTKAKADQEKQGGGGIGGVLPGGIGGMFGKKKKTEEPPKDAPAASAPAPTNRATIMTTTTELVSVETSVAAADLEIPPGFKQK